MINQLTSKEGFFIIKVEAVYGFLHFINFNV